MRLCVLDHFRAGHLRKRLGGFAGCAGKPNARLAAILREYLAEDIGTFADICGQSSWRRYNSVGFVLLRFDQPLLTRTTLHCSLNESLLFIWGQIARRLSRSLVDSNRNGGSPKPSPINFFTAHDGETLTHNVAMPRLNAVLESTSNSTF